MAFRDDRRAAAIQVGAVLLLGFLVIGLSLYQATVVPAENKRVEFRHSQTVQNDMLDLRNALLRAGTSESVQPVSVDMGTTYPSRVLFVNPPPPGGLLRNGSERAVTFGNVSATNRETRDFLNTSANGPYDLATKNVSYRPGYNVYRSAPTTTYQTGVAVNEFEDEEDVAVSGQTLVQGNRVYLVAVAGNLSRAQVRSLSVDPRSLSTSTRSTAVRNTTGGPVTITVPTTLSASRWETLLAAEVDDTPGDSPDSQPNKYVTGVDQNGSDAVDVTLERNETYRLTTALVGVGTGGSAPGPAYLTEAETRGSDDVTLEVRDRFNNPVPNSRVPENLTVNVTAGRDLVTSNRTAVDEAGRVGLDYAATASVDGGSDPLNATLEYENGTPVAGLGAANRSVNLTVTEADLGVGATDPGDPNDTVTSIFVLNGASLVDRDTVRLTIKNNGSETESFVGHQLGFATELGSNANFNDGPDAITSVSYGGTVRDDENAVEYREPYSFDTPVDSPPPGGSYDVTIDLDQQFGQNRGVLLSVRFYVKGVGILEYTLTFQTAGGA
ncbi:MAG: hypothetical protein ABEH47_08020 [Haloferacaceae archaeon]